MHEIACALAESATLVDAAPRMLAAVCGELGWEYGGLWEVDRAGKRLRCIGTWHEPSLRFEPFAEISRAIAALQAVNILLTPAQLQVGYRTRDEVAFYLLHAQQIADAFVDHEGNAVDPLDLALQMKILPRIAGDSNAIKRAVFGLLGWATTGVPLESPDEVNSILDAWETAERPSSLANSEYPRLAARLCLMWQRLEVDGYTSYWL